MDTMDRRTEFETKLDRVRRWLVEQDAGALLVKRRPNFAWLSCGGRNHVSTAADSGPGAILVTPERVAVLANNIEGERLAEEELAGLPIELISFPWYEPARQNEVVEQFVGGAPVTDTDEDGNAEAALKATRASLLEPEVDRLRCAGRLTTRLVELVCWRLQPGWSEHRVASEAHHALASAEGASMPVCLVAADERIAQRRHPLPTDNAIEARAMVVVCIERDGLVCSATRLVSFVAADAELRHRHEAVCRVDAAAIAATVAGRPLRELFAAIVDAYKAEGFPDEWQLHHQGGTAGYQPREMIATPTTEAIVQPRQAVAWNPSITGTKSEDTILATETGFEWITAPGEDWPVIELEMGGQTLRRAAVLQRG